MPEPNRGDAEFISGWLEQLGLTSYLQLAPVQTGYLPAQRALDMVDQSVSQQAALLSFVDDFRYLALACAVCVPVVFLLKKAKAKKGAVSSAH